MDLEYAIRKIVIVFKPSMFREGGLSGESDPCDLLQFVIQFPP
jgi:hypothetical protein